MKTSMRKLRGLSLHKHHAKGRGDPRPSVPQLDELARASQDMQDMRDCYDNLLSAAAATANSAYEFSESLQEMGACLLEKTALNDDEESGKVLLMLGKVQFQLKKLVDGYRSHIFQTITSPSESLLNELRVVEEMKRQCDEKRNVYEYMRTRQKEKGRSRTTEGDSFSGQQVKAARDEYEDEATLFVFRLKSLKQGQSRSLLTQAAHHHAAQLCFVKKALNSLETVDPHVKLVTEQQHIDYLFSGLDDDGGDDSDDDDDYDSYDVLDDGELSFDYGQNDHDQDLSISQHPIELDQVNLMLPHVEAVKENLNRPQRSYFSFRAKTGSQSAPLFSENRSEIAEKIRQTRPTTREFHTYVLPTPVGIRSSISPKSNYLVTPSTIQTSLNKQKQNMYHSSPLEPRKYENIVGNEKTSGPTVVNPQYILRESNSNTTPTTRLPLPSTDGLLFPQNKRLAFSGPITGKPWTTKLDPMDHHPQLFSGPILRNATPQPSPPSSSSSKLSPVASPTFLSSPKISELHELPRPPINSLTLKSPRSLIPRSALLISKGQVVLAVNNGVATKAAASPLPVPPQSIMARSFSIPSRDHMETSLTSQDIASSPLITPIALSTSQVKGLL